MRRFLLLFFAYLFAINSVFAQKEVVSNKTSLTWESLGDYSLCGNGKFGWYAHAYSNKEPDIILFSTEGKIVREFVRGASPLFTTDGKSFICQLGDTIEIFRLLTKKVIQVVQRDLITYQLIETSGRVRLILRTKNAIHILDPENGKKISYEGLDEYFMTNNKAALVIKTKLGLSYISLVDFKMTTLTQDSTASDIQFDHSGKKVIFTIQSNEKGTSLYVFSSVSGKVKFLASDSSGELQKSTIDRSSILLNTDGRFVCFGLVNPTPLPSKYEADMQNKMELWHYKTRFLNDDNFGVRQNTFVSVSLSDSISTLTKLGEGRIECVSQPGNRFVLLKYNRAIKVEEYQNDANRPIFKLVSISNGELCWTLPTSSDFEPIVQVSTNSRYLLLIHSTTSDIYCYEIATGRIINATALIHLPNDIKYTNGSIFSKFQGISKWLENDSAFLVFDKYDLWQIDPKGEKKPINLTGGYGRKNEIKFKLSQPTDQECFVDGKEVLVAAMNSIKDNGLGLITLGKEASLKISKLQPALIEWSFYKRKPVIKAELSNKYLLTIQTAECSPNLFFTKDLVNYKKITNFHNEQKYVWLTSELINYQMPNGRTGSGILYKPENIDKKKKYPIIFNYYQFQSDLLHEFKQPALFENNIVIPWYVSNGYLVFIPDILNFEPGQITENTVNAVDGAIDYLSRYPWIDTTRIGLQGHSFGGYETNILIANSKKKFAAAQAMSGISDAIGGSLGLSFKRSGFSMYENGQFNFGSSLWDRQPVYIENSPVLKADKISTPLLLLHNKKDGAVPFYQSEALFYALRRLNKPVWLINYKDGGHQTPGGTDEILDFTIRQQQFFDHYLKGKPTPKWMIDGSLSLDPETQ